MDFPSISTYTKCANTFIGNAVPEPSGGTSIDLCAQTCTNKNWGLDPQSYEACVGFVVMKAFGQPATCSAIMVGFPQFRPLPYSDIDWLSPCLSSHVTCYSYYADQVLNETTRVTCPTPKFNNLVKNTISKVRTVKAGLTIGFRIKSLGKESKLCSIFSVVQKKTQLVFPAVYFLPKTNKLWINFNQKFYKSATTFNQSVFGDSRNGLVIPANTTRRIDITTGNGRGKRNNVIKIYVDTKLVSTLTLQQSINYDYQGLVYASDTAHDPCKAVVTNITFGCVGSQCELPLNTPSYNTSMYEMGR